MVFKPGTLKSLPRYRISVSENAFQLPPSGVPGIV